MFRKDRRCGLKQARSKSWRCRGRKATWPSASSALWSGLRQQNLDKSSVWLVDFVDRQFRRRKRGRVCHLSLSIYILDVEKEEGCAICRHQDVLYPPTRHQIRHIAYHPPIEFFLLNSGPKPKTTIRNENEHDRRTICTNLKQPMLDRAGNILKLWVTYGKVCATLNNN